MRLFQCQVCSQVLHFESTSCERCGSTLGFLSSLATLSALERDGRAWRALAQPEGRFRFCANAGQEACNWLIPARATDSLCRSCRHNRTIPDLSAPEALAPWRRWEVAKHRLTYTLMKLRLPVPDRVQEPGCGLAFDILEGPPPAEHAEGLITLALAEAEEPEGGRRTLLDHLRHESGHVYWNRLVRDRGKLPAFRSLFGDERQSTPPPAPHFAGMPPVERPLSPEAQAHPLEAFAEAWAYYLNMVDTLEMATSLDFAPPAPTDAPRSGTVPDPYDTPDIAGLVEAWLPLTLAVNSLSRCMGTTDLYAASLSPLAIEKLAFIHGLVRDARQSVPVPKGN